MGHGSHSSQGGNRSGLGLWKRAKVISDAGQVLFGRGLRCRPKLSPLRSGGLIRAPSHRIPGHARAPAGVAGYNPGLLSALTDYNSSGTDSPSDMAGPNSDTPAATRPSPTEIRLVQLLRSAASGPPAGGGWQQPEADFLKCKSGPKWQRRAAAGYGHAREQHAI